MPAPCGLVIGNLIQNAINYSPDRKEIELKVYRLRR